MARLAAGRIRHTVAFTPRHAAGSAEEAGIREVLQRVPIDRLRSAGVLHLVLACAEPAEPSGDEQVADAVTEAGELAAMDLEALVDLALDERGN